MHQASAFLPFKLLQHVDGLYLPCMQAPPQPDAAFINSQQPQQPQLSREMVIGALKKLMMQLDCSQEDYTEKFQSVSVPACTPLSHGGRFQWDNGSSHSPPYLDCPLLMCLEAGHTALGKG